MRENKGTYQNKGTFASCKASAKDLQTVSIPLHPVVLSLYLVPIACNQSRPSATFQAIADNLSFSLSLYYIYIHQYDLTPNLLKDNFMSDFIFVYNVDTIKKDGSIESFIMILDHEELFDIIHHAISRQAIISRVAVTMYDISGKEVAERDITRFLSSRIGS